jgi:hypothetical protein
MKKHFLRLARTVYTGHYTLSHAIAAASGHFI